MLFTDAIKKFHQAKKAERYSYNTLTDYGNTYKQFLKYMGYDPKVDQINLDIIQAFLGSLTLSRKTVQNYRTGLSSLWRWMVEQGHARENIILSIKIRKPSSRVILPYEREEVVLLLEAARLGTQPERDEAIVLTLLDTGMRASELCAVRTNHIDFKRKRILVLGKGDKERRVRFSERTLEAIKKYLEDRRAMTGILFRTIQGKGFNRNTLRLLIARLGLRAGVPNCHPHRFRHTFAVEYLANGGNVFALQEQLGHSSLDMVKRYLEEAEKRKIDRHFERASPVINWEL